FSSAMVSNPGVLLEPASSTKSILLDSTINHGNSGGALLNDKGQVIGVVFARLESEGEAINQLYGVGCAIQSTDVMNYIDKEVKIIDPNASYTKAV
ncbi:MAG: trypsin-like serine protease, partial [Clostridia bacterium]